MAVSLHKWKKIANFAKKNRMRKIYIILLLLCTLHAEAKIDRKAWVTRHNPHITKVDTLASLSVGNGEFAMTCDVTGLQTFHRLYSKGVALGTMAQWGWHSFANTEGYEPGEVLKAYDFGRGSEELYSCQLKDERGKRASDFLRANPHRLHLGIVGFADMEVEDIRDINQTLDLWNGLLHSQYTCKGQPMEVTTSCAPHRDRIVASINDPARHAVEILFPYPTGKHSDDACDWSEGRPHSVRMIGESANSATFCHIVDADIYYITLTWDHAKRPVLKDNVIRIEPQGAQWALGVEFTKEQPKTLLAKEQAKTSLTKEQPKTSDTDFSTLATQAYWNDFWTKGGAVDFSHCTDVRARELERRVVLSQYLLAIQCAGSTPPQETGLTYNSWFGKFHLEMIWWHQAHFALWGHEDMLARTLPWYEKALPMAQDIAQRQGLDGARWMKMTDPSAKEAPSNTGSFLIWQQPHLIYLCELLYRSTGDKKVLRQYAHLVEETARCMASFVTYDEEHHRYILKGCIPAQETLKAGETVNPPFELSYWHFALQTAQQWRKRLGQRPVRKWDDILRQLSPLSEKDGVYSASEDTRSYPSLKPQSTASGDRPFEASELPENIKLYSDHMAVLASCGVLPVNGLFNLSTMQATLEWVMANWNWDKTWGWDFPTTCMTAVRTGHPEIALEALLKDCRTNTYLPNGHNYQDSRLRCYLPGNGGLLTAVALMCAGYDGCETSLPGFPKDGKWNVEFENIKKLP